MKIRILALAAALMAIVPAILDAQHADMPGMSPPKTPATLLTGTGSHHHPIATTSPEAQKFFDQGMATAYGFNHEEAYRSFARAAELDPKAAMPRWGMALVLGSNYNDPAPVDERLLKARAEVEKALALAARGPENERAYVEALAIRYVADPAAADKPKIASDYATAMKAALAARYPDDLDAATLYAESLMNLTPWKLWSPDGSRGADTVEIVAVLESVLKRDPNHPGANHYYIHADRGVEESRARASLGRRGSRRSCRRPATSCTCPPMSTFARATTSPRRSPTPSPPKWTARTSARRGRRGCTPSCTTTTTSTSSPMPRPWPAGTRWRSARPTGSSPRCCRSCPWIRCSKASSCSRPSSRCASASGTTSGRCRIRARSCRFCGRAGCGRGRWRRPARAR